MIVTEGSTDVVVPFYFVDDVGGTAPGEPTTGLLFSNIETGGSASYQRQGAARVDFTLVTQTAAGAHTDGGFVLVDDTEMEGVYRCDIPDAAVAAGVDFVIINLRAASANNTVARPLKIDLTSVDLRDSVRGGMTALPNAAADGTGGLVVSDAGGLDIDNRLISATATANHQDMYDGTGYTDPTAPSTQSQLSGIANVGSAVNKPAFGYTLNTGTQSANTFSNTQAVDQVRHTHTDAAGVLDLVYHFQIGGGTPSSVQITGYVQNNNDDIDVFVYDWVTTSYRQVGNIEGANGANDIVVSFGLFVDEVGSGADEGKVDVMFGKTSGLTTATLAIDQIYVAFNQGVEGYDNGAVWFNSNVTNTGTEVNLDGTARNPVSTSAALLTLMASTRLHKIEMTPGSTLTLGGAYEGFTINGNGGVLALGGQNIGGSVWERFSSVTGIGTTSGSSCFFETCIFGAATVPPSVQHLCGYGSTMTFGSAGDYEITDGYSVVAGSGSPTFTKTALAAVTFGISRWARGITVSGIEAGDVGTIDGGFGTVTLNGADGTVELRGIYKALVDNRTGSPTLNTDGAIKGVDVASIQAKTTQLTFASGLVKSSVFGMDADVITGNAVQDSALDGKGDWALASLFTGITLVAEWLGLIAGKQVGNSAARTEIRATGAGSGTFDETTDSIEANRDAALTAAQVNTEVDTALTDYDGPTRTEATADKDAIITQGDIAWTTGAGGSPPDLLQSTTIATLATQISFTLTAGSTDDDAYNGAMAVITDSATSTQKAVGTISDYVGATKTVTLSADPGVYTMAVGDAIAVIANTAGSVTVYPLSSTATQRVNNTSVKQFKGEADAISIPPTDANGDSVDTTGMTLKIVIEQKDGTDVEIILDANITKGATSYSFTPLVANDIVGEKKWSCRRTDTNGVIGEGSWSVDYAAEADA